MKIAVTGSIATDHLMHFPGRFADQLIADQLRQGLAVVPRRRPGGPARRHRRRTSRSAWASSACARLLVGAVGADFADYRSWLERHGVDCDSVHVSEIAHTARFVCTTDDDMCQIASFYAGAMSEARNIELAPVADRLGGLDLVLDRRQRPGRRCCGTPQECRERGLRRSPPTRRSSSPGWPARRSLQLIDGADVPVHQRVREGAARAKTGLTDDEVLDRVGDPGHHARQGRRARSPAAASTRSTCRSRGRSRRRPDRRRRRLPRRLLRRAVLGPAAWSGPPRSARCWPRWCWRPSAPRSTRSAATSSSSGSPSPTATTCAADVRPLLRV